MEHSREPTPPVKLPVESTRLSSVDVFKTLAIIGVVFHHLSNRTFDSEMNLELIRFKSWFAWCVYAFLFLAGYLQAKSKKTPSRISILKDRAKRLLIPYLVLGNAYALLMHALVLWTTFVSQRYSCSLWEKYTSLLLVQSKHPGAQLYFFPLLFVATSLYVLFPGNLQSTSRKRVLLLLSFGGTIWVGYNMVLEPTGWSLPMIPVAWFLFCLGAYLPQAKRNRMDGILLFATISILLALGFVTGKRFFFLVAFPTPMLLACERLPQFLLNCSFFRLTGEASGTIFAYHIPFVLYPLIRITQVFVANDWINLMISVPLTFVICIAFYRATFHFRWLKPFRI